MNSTKSKKSENINISKSKEILYLKEDRVRIKETKSLKEEKARKETKIIQTKQARGERKIIQKEKARREIKIRKAEKSANNQLYSQEKIVIS